MKKIYPKVGHLVRLKEDGKGWAPRFMGVVAECEGIRCLVRWSTGKYDWWLRSSLEVIDEGG